MNSYSPQTRPPLGPRTSSSSSAQSHQTGTITEHWNDIPARFTPSSTSRSVSRTVSRTATPNPPRNDPPPTQTIISNDNSNSPDFDALVSMLLSLPSSVPPAEAKLCVSRIQKALPTITLEQRTELGQVIKAVVVDRVESPTWGRERIVDLMMREKGIASWASAVRRLVESVRLE